MFGNPRHVLVAATVLACAAGPAAAADRALVLSTDYSTAYYSRLELQPPYSHAINTGSACADAAARGTAGRAYLLGRYGCDHVQVVDGTSFATLGQFSTGNGTNPQDIEIVSPTKAYVSLYERDFLLIVNPQTGATLGTVSLAAFTDSDGLPEAADMALVGSRLFVALQRLDRNAGYTAANPSFLAVVDLTTDQLLDVNPQTPGVQAIPLTGRNPFGELQVDVVRQRIVVPEAGNFGFLDGGGEFVDPVTLQAEGFFITESQLGGDLNCLRLWTDCTGWAIVNDSTYRTKLVRFDRCNGQVLGTPWQSAGFDLCDVEIDFARGQLLVSDRDLLHPGVRVFAAGPAPSSPPPPSTWACRRATSRSSAARRSPQPRPRPVPCSFLPTGPIPSIPARGCASRPCPAVPRASRSTTRRAGECARCGRENSPPAAPPSPGTGATGRATRCPRACIGYAWSRAARFAATA